MKSHASNDFDREMMKRCICIAVQSGNDREYPYGVILCRDGKIVAESTNRVAHERDVTRHAEVVVISRAQQILGTNSLSDCVIYVSLRLLLLCNPGEQDRARRLRSSFSADGRRFKMECSDRRAIVQQNAGGIRSAAGCSRRVHGR